MKSKQIIKGFFLIISIIFASEISAKSLDKLYVSLLTEKGTVYHTYPMDFAYIGRNDKDLSVSKLKYDYTYIDSKDSVDMLMTVNYNVLSKPEQISFDGSDYYPTSIIYIDNKGKKFIYRIQCTFPYNEWIQLYSSPKPFNVNLKCEDGIDLQFTCPEKKWLEMSNDFMNLFKLIEKAK